MTLSQRLDVLQQLAQVHVNESLEMYLIDLLAEHAEEDEMTIEFLDWIERLLSVAK